MSFPSMLDQMFLISFQPKAPDDLKLQSYELISAWLLLYQRQIQLTETQSCLPFFFFLNHQILYISLFSICITTAGWVIAFGTQQWYVSRGKIVRRTGFKCHIEKKQQQTKHWNTKTFIASCLSLYLHGEPEFSGHGKITIMPTFR